MKTASIILRGGPVNKPEEKRELWREDYVFSEQNGELIERRETYIDNEETRLFRKNIGRSQIPRKKTIQSSSIQNDFSTTGLIEYGEEGESSASIRVEIREENLGTVEPSQNRRERAVSEMTSDGPRDFQNQRTRREETSQPQTNTSNYPSLFTSGLNLLILGGLGLLWFALLIESTKPQT